MAIQKNVDECLKWIADQQEYHDRAGFGNSRPETEVAVNEQRQRSKDVNNYASNVDRIKSQLKDQKQKENLEKSYTNLKETAHRKLECLENNTKIVGLEHLFSPLSTTIHNTSANLVQAINQDSKLDTDNTGYNAQRCILATRSAWEYITKQLKCSETQLKHASEYYQFFHDMKQYRQWMPADLRTVNDVIKLVNKRENGQLEEAIMLLPEMKAALAMYLNWRSRMNSSYERSSKVLPIHLRSKRLNHERPITSLCDYRTGDLNITEGEEMVILDNTKPDMWKVRNLRSDIGLVPSVQIVINGPDLAAIDEAMRLRFQFFDTWVGAVRRLGKALINYLSGSLKDWTPEEELKLKALNHGDKQKLRAMLNSIVDVFSPYWDVYAPYKTLLTKIDRLRKILDSSPPRDYRDDGRPPPIVVPQAGTIEEMMVTYKAFWDSWEQFRCLNDAKFRPENVLGQHDWDKYKFLDSIDCLRKWQSDLNQTDEDLMDGLMIEDEVYQLETAKETSETSQISTSEQEEKQTFIIKAVEDPRTGMEISLDEAVALGIINQSEGKFINPATNESMPIPTAMNLGKIKVEFTKTKKSAEKKSDLGLITIKTYGEPRPFNIKGVVDAKSEKRMTVDEAIKAGILDQKRGVYRNMITMQEMSMSDALDSGLLIVEFENDDPHHHSLNGERTVVTKTYAIHAVIDTRSNKRLTFAEAIRLGFMDPETGAYTNKSTRETIYVGDAIKQGWIKASVVNDPKALDIAPGNTINLADSLPETVEKVSVVTPIRETSSTYRQTSTPYSSYRSSTTTSRLSNGYTNGHNGSY